MDTYKIVCDAICEISAIDRDEITPEKDIIEDLGVDSLDFLDITFEIDKTLGIKLPIEAWMERNREDGVSDALVMSKFVAFVDETIANAK